MKKTIFKSTLSLIIFNFYLGNINLTLANDFPFTIPQLSSSPFGKMETTLEKTFLKIDVLHLEIYFNDSMSKIIEKTYQENQDNFKNLKEKLSPQIINTPYALAKIKFLRTIKLNQFLNGVKSNLKLALDQNYISEEIYQEISNNLPHWYSFLKDRKILENDMMYYQIYPNYIRIIYQSSEGKILLDQKDFGEERRKSILASYFADGSEFQEGLIQSLKK